MSDGLEDALAGRELAPAREASHGEVSREGLIRTYRRYAPFYDRVFGAVLEQGRRELALSVARLDARRILEVGVGTGLTLRHYPAAAQVTGIDLSGEMLRKAEARSAALAPRSITLRQMDAEQMDFGDASFDCVTLPYVLSVTPHPARLVAEVRRVCRPGGTIVVLNHFSGESRWRWMERAFRHVADKVGFRSEFDYARHIAPHDWDVQSVRPVNLLRLSKLVVIRNR